MRDIGDDRVSTSASVGGKHGSGGDGERVSSQCDGGMAGVVEHLAQLRRDAQLLDGPGSSQLLKQVREVTAGFEALQLQLVSQVEASGVWRDDPQGTPESFLRSRHGRDHGEARRDVRASKLLAQSPVVRDAADAGLLSRAHLDVLVSIGQKTDVRAKELPAFLPAFVEIGANAPASVLRKVMGAWADQVDPIGTGNDEEDAHRRRYLHVNQVADGVALDGFFAPEAGAKICAAINGVLAELFRDGGATDPQSGMRVASAVQRADALEVIMNRMLSDGGLPTAGGSRAAVTVTVPLARLEQPCCTRAETGDLLDQLTDELSGQQMDASRLLAGGSASIGVSNGPGVTLLSAQGAQRMTCDCEVQRVVISPQGLPLDVGRRMRTFPAHIRKALEIRDGGCVFPGCSKPPGWSEAHHIVHWTQGGATSLENAALLCSNHHHQVHADNHTVSIGKNGRATVILNRRRQ